MSERGSFVTDYIYCGKCFEEAKKLFIASSEAVDAAQVIMSGDKELPIIAGKIGGLYGGEEAHVMEYLLNDLGNLLCDGHQFRVCVIPDSAAPVLLTCRAWRVEVSSQVINPRKD